MFCKSPAPNFFASKIFETKKILLIFAKKCAINKDKIFIWPNQKVYTLETSSKIPSEISLKPPKWELNFCEIFTNHLFVANSISKSEFHKPTSENFVMNLKSSQFFTIFSLNYQINHFSSHLLECSVNFFPATKACEERNQSDD